MDILSDVSINGSLTVNKNLNVTGTSVHQGYLAVNSSIFAENGFGFDVGSVVISKGSFKFDGECFDGMVMSNVYICGIFYGDIDSMSIVRPNAISQTKLLGLTIPSGCQKFMISELKVKNNFYLPAITMIDASTKREVKMDLSVEDNGSGYYYVVASRTSTDYACYIATVIE